MKKKTTLHYYKIGDFRRLELTLDRMSAEGWQAVRPGRLLQHYTFDDSVRFVHRLSVCSARRDSADEISFLAGQKRSGWEVRARRGNWLLFRKNADDAEDGEALPCGCDPIEALFARRIKCRETFRMWMIVLASLLMIVGYCTDMLPILYSFAVPMLLALLVTLQIKYMQEGLQQHDKLL